MLTCPVCAQRLGSIFPLPVAYVEKQNAIAPQCSFDDFVALKVDQYQCPRCQASDRDRLYALYAQHLLRWLSDRPLRLLEIAPTPALSSCLQALARVEYRSGGLMSELAMDKVDITDMRGNYADSRFDFVICSHVLGHVRDDRAAMRELFRVLASGGRAILMVPILTTQLHIDEQDPLQRIRRFGQDDHVRRYAREVYLARLQTCGFDMELRGLPSIVSMSGQADIFRRHGIDQTVMARPQAWRMQFEVGLGQGMIRNQIRRGSAQAGKKGVKTRLYTGAANAEQGTHERGQRQLTAAGEGFW